MKNLKRLLIIALAVIMSASTLVGCGNRGTNSGGVTAPPDADPEKTIVVERVRNGYGDTWLETIAKKFNEVYAKNGWAVTVNASSNDNQGDTVVKRMARGIDKHQIDVWVTGAIKDSSVMADSTYGKQLGSALVEEVTDAVMMQPAIGYDGKEESVIIKDKLNAATADWFHTDGVYYGAPYIDAVAGLAVNTNKLKEIYGYEEMPRTTDELVAMATSIYTGTKADGSATTVGNSIKSKIYPFTYYMNSQYAAIAYYTLIAQYDMDAYKQVLSFNDKDGNAMINGGPEVYKDEALQHALEVISFSLNRELTAQGAGDTLDAIQSKMTNKSGAQAVFMWNGDWCLNEMSVNSQNAVTDIDFINTPVNSALGYKLFGAGDQFGNKMSKADADARLSLVIKYVDKNMAKNDILTEVQKTYSDVTIDQVDAIATARGIYYSRGWEARVFISKGVGDVKYEVAAHFLRMMASDDAAKSILEDTNCNSVYKAEENKNTTVSFLKNASKISSNQYASVIRWELEGLRKQLGKSAIFWDLNTFLVDLTAANKPSAYANGKQVDGWEVYEGIATAKLEEVYGKFTDGWAQLLKDAGLKK